MSETSPILDKVRIVLVEPQGALNVGAACRAMKNFGLNDLTVVRPGCKLDLDAVKMAMHARDILEATKVVETIPEAIEGSVLVLGTANRKGDYHEPHYTVQEGMKRIKEVLQHGPVTIMFGREEWGLTKDDLQYAQGTMRVMTDPENTSLNLSQAVLLIAYELYQNFGTMVDLPNPHEDDDYELPATVDDLSRLYAHMGNVLSMCEFLPLVNPDALFQVIRIFFHRSKPLKREVNILMGMFSNLRGFMKKYVRNKSHRDPDWKSPD